MTLGVSVEEIARTSTNPLLQFKDDWVRVPLGTVANVQNGFAFQSSCFNTSGVGIPLIRIRDVGKTSAGYFYDGDYDEAFIVRRGDLLVGMDGDFRVATWGGVDALLNQRVCRLAVTSPDYSERFLGLVMQGFLEAIHAETSSVTVKHLSSRSIKEIPLPKPPIDEQKRIVAKIDELFSDLDAGDVALADAERGVLSCRQATLNALVLGSLENPEYAHTVKDGKPVLPDGWKWSTLGDLAEMVQYGTGDKAQSEQTSVPVLRILNVKRGRIAATDLKYMPEGWADLDKYLLRHGDLLFIRTNGSRDLVGTAAMYTGYPENAVSASYLITVRLNPKLATPEFVLHCLNSAFGRGYIASVVSQVGQANVNGTKLKAFPIPLPPLEEQVRLASKADEMLTQLDALQRDLLTAKRQSELLRQSTLAAAFSGQLI